MRSIVCKCLFVAALLGFAAAASARTVPPGADEVDQETYVHTNTAAYNPNTVFGTFNAAKMGLGFDGGDAVAFLKWDMTTITSPVQTVYAVKCNPASTVTKDKHKLDYFEIIDSLPGEEAVRTREEWNEVRTAAGKPTHLEKLPGE